MSGGHDEEAVQRDARDSVFLHATVSLSDGSVSDVFRIRNISKGGLMAEGPIVFEQGLEVDVDLRNIGRVHGRIAWAEERRFGLTFDHAIDPMLARKPVSSAASASAPAMQHGRIIPLMERGPGNA
jgi:hypothetical protein